MLGSHFLKQFTGRLGKEIESIAPDGVRRLQQYAWPGNIRELQNVIERAVIVSRGRVIQSDELFLPEPLVARAPGAADGPIEEGDGAEPPAPSTLAEAEREAILAALHVAGWRISGNGGAACRLGLKPTTLHAKMKKLGIHRPNAVPSIVE
jgi:DNA-binding NtrC family response regulator